MTFLNSLIQLYGLVHVFTLYLPAMWRPGFNPWVGKLPWRSEWQLTLVFLPGEFRTKRNLRLPSMGSQRVGHGWATNTFTWNLSILNCTMFISKCLSSIQSHANYRHGVYHLATLVNKHSCQFYRNDLIQNTDEKSILVQKSQMSIQSITHMLLSLGSFYSYHTLVLKGYSTWVQI